MAILRRLLEKRDLTEQAWMRGTSLWGRQTAAGVDVTPAKSLELITVYACVSLIAETIGGLPLITYRYLADGGRERDPRHVLYPILHDKPNPEMTSVELWEATVGHIALRGNAYHQKVPLGNGGYELWPLRPDRMRVFRDGAALRYLYTLPSGEERRLDPSQIMHIRGWSYDGLIGYSRVHLAREALGLGLALEEFSARLFSNGAEPGGVLKTSSTLSDEAFERLKTSWAEAHQGLDRAHRVAILEEGVEWQSVSMSGRDAQFLEARKLSRADIATLFRVPPHLIGDVERSTSWGTGIEQQGIGFVTHTLRPYLTRIEKRLGADVLTEPSHFAEFLVDGLLRGDMKTRMESYAIMRTWGLRTANQIARWENWEPIPADQGGDTILFPMNMVPAEQALQGQDQGGGDGGQRSLRDAGAGSAASRLKLADRYERLFAVEARRLVNREVSEVRTAAERHLNRRDAQAFLAWLRDYYERFGAVATRQMIGLMQTYGEAVLDDAAAEIGSDDPQIDGHQSFIRGYAQEFGTEYAASSQGQLEQILTDALAAGDDELEAVTTRLDEWSETRPRKVSSLETVNLAGALCVSRWRRGGITRIRWVLQGGKTCRFCRKLGGQVVGIEQTFANAGDSIEGDEGQEPLKVFRETTHPPIHGFCKCGLRPERG